MKRINIIKKSFLIAFVVSILSPVVASSTPILADLMGSRSVGSGITATNGTKESSGWESKGFNISWLISPTIGGYNYSYTLDPLYKGGVSHLILEVSEIITQENIDDYLDFGLETRIEGPRWWTDQEGNPNMNGQVYGIKLDFGDDPITYSFFSTQIPIWGDFYTKDGAYGQAWNTGFGSDPTGGPFINWIATPDTVSVSVPEPTTLLLFGAGLLGIVAIGRRKFKK